MTLATRLFDRFDDSSLAVSCVPRSVVITTEMVPDAARGPALVGVYRRVRPLSTDKINIDLWTVKYVVTISFSHKHRLCQD